MAAILPSVQNAQTSHEPAPADEATLTPVKAGQASQQGEGGGEDAPASLANTIRQDEPVDAVVGGTQPADDRRNSEPGHGHVGEMPTMATRQGGRASSDALPVRAVIPGGVHIPHHGVVRA